MCSCSSQEWQIASVTGLDLTVTVLSPKATYQFILKQMRIGFTGIRAFRRPLYLVPQPSTLLWRNERWWVAWKPNFGLLTYFYRNFEGTPRRSTISSLFKRKILYFICSFTSTSFDSAYAVSRHPNLWCIFRRPACHSSDFWLIPEWCFIVTSWQTACQWGIRWRKPRQKKENFLKWLYRQPMDWLEEVTTSNLSHLIYGKGWLIILLQDRLILFLPTRNLRHSL